MSKPITYEYECPDCQTIATFEITPYDPGRTSGPPEDCYPPEGGEADGPEECEKCGCQIDSDKVYEEWADKAADDYDYEPDDHRYEEQ